MAGESLIFSGANARTLAMMERSALGRTMRSAGASVAVEGGYLRSLRLGGQVFDLRVRPQVVAGSSGTFQLFAGRIEQLVDGQWTTIERGPW